MNIARLIPSALRALSLVTAFAAASIMITGGMIFSARVSYALPALDVLLVTTPRLWLLLHVAAGLAYAIAFVVLILALLDLGEYGLPAAWRWLLHRLPKVSTMRLSGNRHGGWTFNGRLIGQAYSLSLTARVFRIPNGIRFAIYGRDGSAYVLDIRRP